MTNTVRYAETDIESQKRDSRCSYEAVRQMRTMGKNLSSRLPPEILRHALMYSAHERLGLLHHHPQNYVFDRRASTKSRGAVRALAKLLYPCLCRSVAAVTVHPQIRPGTDSLAERLLVKLDTNLTAFVQQIVIATGLADVQACYDRQDPS